MPDERDRLALGVHDSDDVGEQDFRCRGQLVLGEARRLPVTAQVGGEDVPVVAPVPDQVRPGRARLGQPVHEHHGPRVRAAVPVDRQRHHGRSA